MNDSAIDKSRKIKSAGSIVVLILAACLIYGFSAGISGNSGVLAGLISSAYPGVSYTDMSFIFSISTIVTGILIPFMAYLSIRISNIFVLITGILASLFAFIGITAAQDTLILGISIILFLSIGFAALSYGVIFGIIKPSLGTEITAIAVSIVSCSAIIFSTITAPVINLIFDSAGLTVVTISIITVYAVLIPIAFYVSWRQKKTELPPEIKKETGILKYGKQILTNRYFILAAVIFFVFGFSIRGLNMHLFESFESGPAFSLITDMLSLSSGTIVAMTSLATGIGTLSIGVIAAKIHKEKHLHLLFIDVLSITVLMTVMMVFKTTPLITFSGLLILSFLSGTILPIGSIIICDKFSSILIGATMGLTALMNKLGTSLETMLGALNYNITESFTISGFLAILVGIAGTAVVLIFIVIEKKDTNRT